MNSTLNPQSVPSSPEVVRTPILSWAIALLSAIAIFLLITPISPVVPSVGLDASWKYAVNEALKDHLVFGRDLIFTYGPLASVDTRMYSPGSFWAMIIAGAFVAVGFCAGATLTFPRGRVWHLALMLAVMLPIDPRDAVFAVIALFLCIACLRLTLPADHDHALRQTPWIWICIVAVSASLGLVPLIKGSLTGVVIGEGALSMLMLFGGRQYRTACVIVFTAIIAMVIGWVLCGQPLSALPQFFIAQSPIISGYSEAMTIVGPTSQLKAFVIGAVVALGCLWMSAHHWPKTHRLILCLGVALYLFIQFKAGFIRQDGHTIITSAGLMLAAVIVASFTRPAPATILLVVSALCSYYVMFPIEDRGGGIVFLTHTSAENARASIESIGNLANQATLKSRFENARGEIAHQEPLPKVAGSVDIYPVEMAAIFANGLSRAGRPVFQSYSAYTPALDRINADHLLGAKAPQHIFFAIAPIDQRLPALDDASSWPILLSSYTISDYRSQFLQMDRNAVVSAPSSTELSSGHFSLGEAIPVPQSEEPIVARIDLHQSLVGRILTTAFRSPRVLIEVVTDDGQTRTYRYIPGMGENGFVLSPFVASTDDFLKLATGDSTLSRVTSIRLLTPHTDFWSKNFRVSFSALHVKPQSAKFTAPTSGPLTQVPFDKNAIPNGGKCSLDAVNGVATPTLAGNDAKVSRIASLMGWMTIGDTDPQGAEQQFIELTSTDGVRRYYRADPYARPDVIAYFNRPNMRQPGVSTVIGMAGLSGKQSISFVGMRNGHAARCQVRSTITVTSPQ